MHKRNIKQQGTAILMALLIIAIVASISISITRMQTIYIRQTQMMLTSEQAMLYTQGVICLAKNALIEIAKNPDDDITWPITLPPQTIADGQGKMQGTLWNADGFFNLNNFANENMSWNIKNNKHITAFRNLLDLLNLQLSDDQKTALVDALTSWVSYNPENEFESVYRENIPPYQSGQQHMASVSEFRTVAGVTPLIYNQLLPYIFVLPEYSKLNMKVAPPLILQAYGTTNENLNKSADTAGIKTTSKFYLLHGDVYLDNQHTTFYALLSLNSAGKEVSVTVNWQTFGTL